MPALSEISTSNCLHDSARAFYCPHFKPEVLFEHDTIPGKIAPVMRINATTLFSADRVLHSHDFTTWLDRYIRPIVRIGSTLEPGQPEESLAPCWNAATGARCHTDLATVRRPEGAIVSICPKCGCMTLIDFWQATPWNTLNDE